MSTSTLQTTLETAVAEYNKLAESVAQAQKELLVRQGAIQQLDDLIKAEAEAETETESEE